MNPTSDVWTRLHWLANLGRIQLENVALLGFASSLDGFPMSTEEIRSRLEKDQREKVRTMNLAALDAGAAG